MTEKKEGAPRHLVTLVDAANAFDGLIWGDPACTVDFVRGRYRQMITSLEGLPRSRMFYEEIIATNPIEAARMLALGVDPETGGDLIDREGYLSRIRSEAFRVDVEQRYRQYEQLGVIHIPPTPTPSQ